MSDKNVPNVKKAFNNLILAILDIYDIYGSQMITIKNSKISTVLHLWFTFDSVNNKNDYSLIDYS